jgi:uncharacterized protein (DUF302 family)
LESLIVLSSKYTVNETIDRLVILLEGLKMTIYARINRHTEFKRCGPRSQSMQYILFDDPKLSGYLIEKYPILALGFPMKIIAWQDGGCKVAYEDPVVMMQIHDPTLERIHWPDLRTNILQALEK